MEIWLRNDRLKFQLPVNPPEIKINGTAKVSGEGIVRYGDISIYAGRGLRKVEISSIFPNHEYNWVEYKPFPKPYTCVDNVNSWFRRGSPVLFTVTGTNINMYMTITDFNYGEQDGTGDVYYTISMIEYVDTQSGILNSDDSKTKRPVSNSNSSKQRTHKVVKGDNLYDIAQKYYGKGSYYPKIKEANASKYPSLKKSNLIYPYMELVIP